MILIVGTHIDKSLTLVAKKLDQLGHEYRWLDQTKLEKFDIDWRCANGKISGNLKLGNEYISLENIKAVYKRPIDIAEVLDPATSPETIKSLEAKYSEFARWADLTNARVVTKGIAQSTNTSKPYQLQLIRKQGFVIPETLVTNSESEARKFLARHPDAIYKSISAIRSIAQRVKSSDLDRLDLLTHCPVMFQRYISGTNVRVHVVGEEIHATAIHTPALDYRYAGDEPLEMVPCYLPTDVEKSCIELTSKLGLEFSGIDLIRTENDEYFCLEVNPMPAYGYFQGHSAQDIADSLAKLLTKD